jgi:hypothetical protein
LHETDASDREDDRLDDAQGQLDEMDRPVVSGPRPEQDQVAGVERAPGLITERRIREGDAMRRVVVDGHQQGERQQEREPDERDAIEPCHQPTG